MNYCKSQGGSIASIHSAKENDVVAKLAKTFAYIGAESDGHGHWKWDDGSKWWQPDDEDTDGLWGHSDTRIAIDPDDYTWNDWGDGNFMLGVICAKAASTTTAGTTSTATSTHVGMQLWACMHKCSLRVVYVWRLTFSALLVLCRCTK